MSTVTKDQRVLWLLAGVCAGVCLSYLWPVEPVKAVATDREERFAICTVETGLAAAESVFVLDFLTGRLIGATLNQQTGTFTNFYMRNIAADFEVAGNAKLKFAMIPGRADLTTGGGVTGSAGVIYVGELNSGKVLVYRFPFRQSTSPLPPETLMPLPAILSFREVTTKR